MIDFKMNSIINTSNANEIVIHKGLNIHIHDQLIYPVNFSPIKRTVNNATNNSPAFIFNS